MAELIMKQVVAVIDRRTTLVCLNAAGQIRLTSEPFETLNGQVDVPPFHVSCRSMVVPYVRGTVNTQRADANAELKRRPVKDRDPRKASWPPLPKPKKKRVLTPPRRARRKRS